MCNLSLRLASEPGSASPEKSLTLKMRGAEREARAPPPRHVEVLRYWSLSSTRASPLCPSRIDPLGSFLFGGTELGGEFGFSPAPRGVSLLRGPGTGRNHNCGGDCRGANS